MALDKFDYLIISPHLDDAIVSLGQHILNWQKEGKSIKIITVFTRFGDEHLVSENGWQYLIKSGFDSVKKFETARRHDDLEVMKELSLNYEYLEYVDGAYRHINRNPVYTTSSALMSGHISPFDASLVNEIYKTISQQKFTQILFPFGVGGHVDHAIIRQVGDKFKKDYGASCSYYLESPYIWRHGNYLKYLSKILSAKSYVRAVDQKMKLLKKYPSQSTELLRPHENFYEVIVK